MEGVHTMVTADGMYVLRQMVEKILELQSSMALRFIDLEKAFDTVPREMVMATLRSMGVPEAEVRMVEGHEVEDTMKKLLYADDLALVANGKRSYRIHWRSRTGYLPETG